MNAYRLLHFKHTDWMISQIRQIGRSRFSSTYWPSLDKAISNCLESHSYVIVKDGDHSAICQWQIAEPGIPTILAFILVCPPFSEDVSEYGLCNTPIESMFEIAFVAVAPNSEGKGYAKQLITRVLMTSFSMFWLHVDTVNVRAKKLYESLGMTEYSVQSDPYGAEGSIMISLPLQSRWNADMEIRTTLLDTSPCKTEKTFCGSIFTPPLMASY